MYIRTYSGTNTVPYIATYTATHNCMLVLTYGHVSTLFPYTLGN